jgi:4-aminobutyrate aminotransferase-like enzyme
LERELIVIDCGPDANVIRFVPPLVTTQAELNWAIDLVDQALHAHESGPGN